MAINEITQRDLVDGKYSPEKAQRHKIYKELWNKTIKVQVGTLPISEVSTIEKLRAKALALGEAVGSWEIRIIENSGKIIEVIRAYVAKQAVR